MASGPFLYEILRNGFLDDDETVHQIGADQVTFDGHGALHQIGEDHATVLAFNGHDVLHHHVVVGLLVLINGGKAHAFSSLQQACQDGAQAEVALLKVRNCSHGLLVSHMVTGILQLNGQVCQLSCVGSVVGDHILHQSGQLLHGGVLALATTAAALMTVIVVMVVAAFVIVIVMTAALVIMIVMTAALMIMLVMMVMLAVVIVQMLVGVRMLVIVFVSVGMFVSMGNTVMGVLMGMGVFVIVAVATDMVVMDMHNGISFAFFFYCSTDGIESQIPVFEQISTATKL